MFGLGFWEIILILVAFVVVFLLLGSRLPKAAWGIGRSIWSFKKGLHESDRQEHDDEP